MRRSKDRKTLYIIFSALLISILTLTTAYAALNVSLKVTGSAQVQSAKWDIHFENIRIKYGSVGANKNPVIVTPTTIDFTVTLNKPGDFFEFSVDVLNKGTIDAMINGINKTPTLSTTQQKYLKYEITYGDGNTINSKQILKPNKLKNIRVLVEYKKDISVSDIPKNQEKIKLGFTLNYSQSDSTAITGADGTGNEIPKLVRMTKGTIDSPKLGDMFCIKDECFYIFKSDINTITGLAQYNLYVGGTWNGSYLDYKHYKNQATGIQNVNMRAWESGINLGNGGISFCNDYCKAGQYTNYKGSNAEHQVLNYKNIIESYGINLIDARMMKVQEMVELGCSLENQKCENVPEWIYSTTYWMQDAADNHNVYHVYMNKLFNAYVYTDQTIGVRPVVTINKSYFK